MPRDLRRRASPVPALLLTRTHLSQVKSRWTFRRRRLLPASQTAAQRQSLIDGAQLEPLTVTGKGPVTVHSSAREFLLFLRTLPEPSDSSGLAARHFRASFALDCGLCARRRRASVRFLLRSPSPPVAHCGVSWVADRDPLSAGDGLHRTGWPREPLPLLHSGRPSRHRVLVQAVWARLVWLFCCLI